jgi:hypothetical protein
LFKFLLELNVGEVLEILFLLFIFFIGAVLPLPVLPLGRCGTKTLGIIILIIHG